MLLQTGTSILHINFLSAHYLIGLCFSVEHERYTSGAFLWAVSNSTKRTFIERNIEQSVTPHSDDDLKECETCTLNTAGQIFWAHIFARFSLSPKNRKWHFRPIISGGRNFSASLVILDVFMLRNSFYQLICFMLAIFRQKQWLIMLFLVAIINDILFEWINCNINFYFIYYFIFKFHILYLLHYFIVLIVKYSISYYFIVSCFFMLIKLSTCNY